MNTLNRNSTEEAGCSSILPSGFAQRPLGNIADLPPSGNTGGKLSTELDPPTPESFVIRPKGNGKAQLLYNSLPADDAQPFSAITDFFNCTFLFDSRNESLQELFLKFLLILGKKFFPIVNRNSGLHGYKQSFRLGDSKAMFAVGGQAGTAFLSLPGEACSLIASWSSVIQFLRDERKATITRWDGAVDDYIGSHSVNDSVALYQAGMFNAGGNKPSCNQNGNWIEPDGKGRTFYVGKRKNGKMLRVYEKGMQLGELWHPWVRWEVELHNKDRIIPWEVLIEPGRYFVGAYPKALSWVKEPMARIKTIKGQAKISYEHLAEFASIAYGPLLNVMLEVEGNPEAVLKRLFRHGVPKRLSHPYMDKPSDFIDSSDGETK